MSAEDDLFTDAPGLREAFDAYADEIRKVAPSPDAPGPRDALDVERLRRAMSRAWVLYALATGASLLSAAAMANGRQSASETLMLAAVICLVAAILVSPEEIK